ncbi:MAG TPA: hypothetical protein DIC46_02460 [Porphyromonadaceae bacterium]|jgi:hypothetical protein|nr:hypothetical protein [Porphyromonadaceae bacterium]
MKERELNNDESFKLIIQMIHNARTNIRARINSRILLCWGYVSAGMSVIIFFLKTQLPAFGYSSLLWLVVPIICYPVSLYLSRTEQTQEKTFFDRLINYISLLFIVTCTTVAFSTFIAEYPVFFIEGLLISIWVTLVGLLVKYKSVVWGGIIGIILSHTLLFLPQSHYQILLFALILVISVIIPAHLFQSGISKK